MKTKPEGWKGESKRHRDAYYKGKRTTPPKGRVVKTIVYQFDELSPKAKEKALEWGRTLNVDFEGWDEGLISEFKEEREKEGWSNVEVYYSGFWSQGDGASFTAKPLNLETWLRKHMSKPEIPKKILEKWKDGEFSIWIEKNTHNYSHSNTMSFHDDFYSDNEELTRKMNQVIEFIKAKSKSQADELYRHLEEAYDSYTSDESVAETIRANEYEFTEDGTRF